MQETDSSPEISATGENIWHLYQEGKMTCASNDYAFGTVLEIEGLGTCEIRDRMNVRYTGTGNVDYYAGKDVQLALSIGRAERVIEVL